MDTERVDDGAVGPPRVTGTPRREVRSPHEVVLVRALRQVAQDRGTGAQGLADRALRAIARVSDLWSSLTLRELRDHVRRVARLLETTQPAMGIFRRWAIDWRRFGHDKTLSLLRGHLRRWMHDWRAQLDREIPGLLGVVRRELPPRCRVLTLSRSASVYRSFVGLPRSRRPREVIVLESRPGGEGRLLARDLRKRGVAARLVPDAEGPDWVGAVDRVIIGADSIYADGSVVHKVGTRPLALAAHRHGTPVLVLSGISKSVPRRSAPDRLPPLFDLTPARAISEYWTDRGVVRGGRWRSFSPRRPARLSRPSA